MTASTTVSPFSRRIHGARPVGAIRHLAAAADVDLRLRMVDDLKAGASEHRLRAGPVRDPPVRLVPGVLLLDEMQSGAAGPLEKAGLRERVIVRERFHCIAAALHGL